MEWARHALWRGLFAGGPVAGIDHPVSTPERGPGRRAAGLAIGFAMAGAWYAPAALATCTALPTVVCTGSINLGTSTIGTGPGTASGASVTVNSGATVTAGNANTISLGDNAVIMISGTVQNSATDGDGYWGGRKNTIEFGSNGALIVQAGGLVSSNGSQNSAEAVNVFGEGNTITNYGTLNGGSSAAIWFQDTTVGAANVIDNYGVISGTNSGSVLGNQGAGADVVFHNRSTGQVYGNIAFAGGNDALILEAGSLITGNFSGGTGTNALTLQGAAGTSDSLAGDITNFQSLIKQGAGTWSLTGTVGNNGGNEPLDVQVQAGTLELLGNNANFNGTVQVDTQGTLLGRAQSLPPTVTDNGQVVFQQPDDGAYSGVISGTGSVTKTDTGVLTLSGMNGYQGGTTISGGTIAVAADSALGASSGGIVLDGGALELTGSFDLGASRAVSITANNGSIVTDAGVSGTVSQGITGAGAFTKGGDGTLILTGGSSYAGGTTIAAGTLQLGNGGASGSLPSGNVADNGTLAFNRSDTVTLANLVTGSGGVAQNGSGTTILTGDNSYAGPTSVNAGALFVDGVQSGAGTATVASGATLGGSGTLGGDVVVNDGGTFTPGGAGTAPGTLTILGNLVLGNGSISAYRFGEANVEGGTLNDLAQVQGNLTLGGTLNVVTSQGGSFDPGVYRVFNYGGALTDNGMVLGTVPSAGFFLQTSVPNQVNLVNTEGLTFEFWDGDAGPKNNGVVNGGNGTWQNYAGNDNWTQVAGNPNAPFTDRGFAVFMAAPGTVNVDGSLGNVNVSGMQFASDGYLVQGDAITLAGSPAEPNATIVRVGDDALDGANYTATIDAVLTGNSSLVKTDLGTLVLGGANTYTGGTAIEGGVLQIGADANLGATGTPLSMDGGTLRTTATFASARATTLNAAGGTFETAAGTQLTLSSPIGGSGALAKTGDGILVLTGDGSYTGGTTIGAGTLQLGDGGTSGGIVGNVIDNGSLVFNRSDTSTLPGNISGSGSITQAGSGTTILTGDNTYTGGTTISAGTLQLGNGGPSGSIVGNEADNGTLVFDRSDVVAFSGLISGSGSVVQAGSGTTILDADDSYTGTTYANAGALVVGDASHRDVALSGGGAVQIAQGGTFGGYGSVAGSVYDSGTLAVADAIPVLAGGGGGTFTVDGTLYNAGQVRVAGATVGNQLATGNYVGQSGNVVLNTVLEDDGSPSDWLTIHGGTASGHSTLQILNAGGRGALTPGNGILVVNAIDGATTERGAFSLAGPVFAGPYEYVLYHGAFDGSNLDSWYLRSEEPSNSGLVGPSDPSEPFEPVPPGEPEGPNEYIPGGREPEVPIYRPETSLYAALPAMALRYNQSLLDSLHERVGDEEQLAGQPGMQQGGFLRGAWFRAIGGSGNANGDANGIYGDGPKYDYDFYALQVGTDVYAKEHDDAQRDHAGLYLAQGRIFGNVANYDGAIAGSDSVTSTSLGLYWTHFWPQDAYVDLVWQGTWNKYKAQSVDALALQKHGFGWAASAEGGYPFHYGNQAFEPQAQVLYQKFDSVDAADLASQVTLRNINSLAARVGVRWADTLVLDQAKNHDEQRQLTSWLRLNVWREFRGQPVAAFSSEDGDVPFHSDMKGNWWQFNGGVTLQLDRMLSFYTSAGYEHGFGPKATGFHGWDGQLGLRWNW